MLGLPVLLVIFVLLQPVVFWVLKRTDPAVVSTERARKPPPRQDAVKDSSASQAEHHDAVADGIEKLYRENRMEEVLKAVASAPVKTDQIRLLEGWAYYRLNRLEEAQAAFSQLRKDRPDAIDATTGLGYCALRAGDLDQAGKLFASVLDQRPENASASEGLGRVRYRQNRLADARDLFERSAAKATGDPEVRAILDKLKAAERHVVIIVVDGLRPDAIAVAPAPEIAALASAGAATLTARAVGIPETLPSFVTMITGLAPARHGVTYDNDRGVPLQAPSLFTRVHDAGGRTALYFGKPKLAMLARADITETRHGPGTASDGTGESLVSEFATEFPTRPAELTLIHLRDPDDAGHQRGWMSPAYLAAVASTDVSVGAIRKIIAGSPVAKLTTVILTADHGGQGKTHASSTEPSWLIPWICTGPGLPTEALQGQITSLDVAPTVLALLGLQQLPGEEGQIIKQCIKS